MKQHHSARTPEQLAAIRGQNNAHRIINETAPAIAEALRPFIGQPILKQDGTLLAKVAKALPSLAAHNYPATHNARAHYSPARCLLWLKTCGIENYTGNTRGDCFAVYRDAAEVIGHIEGAILTRVEVPEPLRADYTPEDIEAARAAVEEAEEALRAARKRLAPFTMN